MESRLCLISPNIQSEVGKRCSAIGCSADLYTKYAENMCKRAVCNYFKRPLLDILIVYNKKNMKKRAIIFLWQKKEVTPVKTVLESP